MSFWKKLFGGGDPSNAAPRVLGEETYNGFTLKAIERKEGGEFQLCGQIEKMVGGDIRTHTFLRADRLPSSDIATTASLKKARQIVDEQGEGVFE